MRDIIETEINKLQNDRVEIEKRVDILDEERNKLTKQLLAIDGAIQASNYYLSKLPNEEQTSEFVGEVFGQ